MARPGVLRGSSTVQRGRPGAPPPGLQGPAFRPPGRAGDHPRIPFRSPGGGTAPVRLGARGGPQVPPPAPGITCHQLTANLIGKIQSIPSVCGRGATQRARRERTGRGRGEREGDAQAQG